MGGRIFVSCPDLERQLCRLLGVRSNCDPVKPQALRWVLERATGELLGRVGTVGRVLEHEEQNDHNRLVGWGSPMIGGLPGGAYFL